MQNRVYGVSYFFITAAVCTTTTANIYDILSAHPLRSSLVVSVVFLDEDKLIWSVHQEVSH